uniref:Uncharacterized protein n=1 Tax=Oryza barthii TaxID=65489 RepID=A0A0D3GXI2_9ORYZ
LVARPISHQISPSANDLPHPFTSPESTQVIGRGLRNQYRTPGPSQRPPPRRASSRVAGRRAGRLQQHGREAWSPRQPAGAALLQGGRLDNGARWLRPRGIEQAAPRQPIRQESGQRLGRSQPWSDLAGFLGRAGDLGGSG